jgi:hypothetical protein
MFAQSKLITYLCPINQTRLILSLTNESLDFLTTKKFSNKLDKPMGALME